MRRLLQSLYLLHTIVTGRKLSLLLILTRRWRAFALSGTTTLLVFALAYWAQPVRYRVFGLYSPPETKLNAEASQIALGPQETPNFLVRVLDFISLRQNKLTPAAQFIKNDELLQSVIQELNIEDFGGNPASPRSLRRRISLSTPNKGAVVKLSLDDRDPDFAKQIVNRLMQRYVDYFSAATPEETVSFTSIIQPQLVNAETLSKQTRQALYQIQLGSNQSTDTKLRAGDQTLELQAIGISLQQQLSTLDADLAQLREMLASATDDQRRLLQQVIKLGEVRQQLLLQLRETFDLPRDSSQLSAGLVEIENQGLALTKELTLAQTQYTKFLGNQQTPWSISQPTEQGAAILRDATLPDQGTRPFLPWFLGAGLLSSLAVGGLVSYLRERQDQSLSSLADIYGQMQLPIFGIISPFSSQELSVQALARQEGTEFQEFARITDGYTQAIQQLAVASLERIPQVLAFTSMVRGEGKSLTVANLAYLLAKQGKKVMVLEADLFHPGQVQFWNVVQSPGLCDCLAGEIQVGKALQRLHPRLDLLQAGYPSKNKDVLLNSPGLSILIQEFRTRYDHILVDTPALEVSVHGYLLANTADATILILRPSHIDQAAVLNLRETVGRSGMKLWGMIINDLQQSPKAFGNAALIRESQWDATIRLQKQKNITGFEISTLSAINPSENLGNQGWEADIKADLPTAQRQKKQEDYLYQLPLDEVKKLVEVLWEDWSHDIELLLEQEEEVVQQSRHVRDLQAQVEQGNPYMKLSSELQLKEEQEKLDLLAEAYVGQRSALMLDKEDLKLYLTILLARTEAEYIPPVQSTDGSKG